MHRVLPQLRRVQDLIGEHRLDEARAVLAGVLRRAPADADANNLMCFVLAHQGEPLRAHEFASRAVAAAPDSPGVLINLGNTLAALSRHDEAVRVLARAAGLDDGPGAWHALVMARIGAGDLCGAERDCRHAILRHPAEASLASDLGWLLHDAGRTQEAADVLRGACARWPDHAGLLAALATVMNYIPGASREEVFEAHAAYGRLLERLLGPSRPPPIRDPDPRRRIRLGLISANFRDHSVSFFTRSMLDGLDPGGFDLVLYDTSPAGGASPSARDHPVRRVAWLDEARLDAAIRADRIDMLMELSGFSLHHRLASMHMKPAPVGLTYIGYPNTTGLRAIDARIVDSITDPPGAERYATESLVRLDPCFLCYSPPGPPPEIAPRPQQRGFVFGSFNHLHKINGALLALWRRVLDASPGSTLVVKAGALRDAGVREATAARFAAAGLGPDRVRVLPPTATRAEHLALYAEVDAALDAFPYNGTTTTCEALWMGVPVVTLAGDSHVSRVGASLLRNCAMADLVAESADQYVATAAALARDPARLAAVRSGLGERFARSVVCDAAAHARRLGDAMREVWRNACARR